MAFRTNTSKANEGNFTLKPEGDYEVIIDTAEVSVTTSGKENIKFKYVVRNDVEQGCQNGIIFHSIWKVSNDKQNDDDMSIGGFNFAQLMAVAQAANLPNNKDYATLDELLKELEGKALKVHLYHKPSGDKTYENCTNHRTTDFPKIKHKPKNSTSGKPAAQKATYTPPAAPVAPTVASDTDDNYPF